MVMKKVIITVLAGALLIASGCSAGIHGNDNNRVIRFETSNRSEEGEYEVINSEAVNSGEQGENEMIDSEALNRSGIGENEIKNDQTLNQVILMVPSFGGVSLGDSPDSVVNALGNHYTKSTEPDVAGMIGEDMIVWSYESGISITFGETSGKVLRVSSTSANFQTDLGIKVGDEAKTVLEAYKPLFKEAVSRHRDEVLAGWFLIGDGAVIIFDFDKSDRALVNSSIPSEVGVEEIILAYWAHFN